MSAPKKSQSSFAKQFQELEEIAAWFEGDAVDLEEGLTKFERGMTLAHGLRERLQEAEVTIERMQQTLPQDNDD
ncbi:MAG: exodeoxyribonuclease VII small subunit [bacterium]|nr:exodeoxyribonuclease VII small subunit [bacterium]